MKKILTLVLVIGFGINAIAQSNYIVSSHSMSASENLSDSYFNGIVGPFILAVTISTHSSSPKLTQWQRTDYQVPAGWHNSVCDFNACYDSTISSKQFLLPSNDTLEPLSIDFYPNTGGVAVSTLHINDVINPSDSTNITFVASVSEPNGVASIKQVKDIYLSPVPVKDNLTVAYDKSVHPGRMEVYNVLGQVVKSIKINDVNTVNVQINLSQLDKGLYFLRVYTLDNNEFTRRFSKD